MNIIYKDLTRRMVVRYLKGKQRVEIFKAIPQGRGKNQCLLHEYIPVSIHLNLLHNYKSKYVLCFRE